MLLEAAVTGAITAAGRGAVEETGAAQVVGATAGGWVRKASAHREGDGIGMGQVAPVFGGGSDAAEDTSVGGWPVTAAACCWCACSIDGQVHWTENSGRVEQREDRPETRPATAAEKIRAGQTETPACEGENTWGVRHVPAVV